MMQWLWTVIAILGLALITLATRAFFMIPDKEVPMPEWLKRGLKYAPLAALAAVIVPELVMDQGALIDTLADARLPASVVAVLYFFWRWQYFGLPLPLPQPPGSARPASRRARRRPPRPTVVASAHLASGRPEPRKWNGRPTLAGNGAPGRAR